MIEILCGAELSRHLAAADRVELFTSVTWLRLLGDTYGIEFAAARDRDSGALLPFAVLDDLRGQRLVSLPFSDYLTFPGDPMHLLDLADAALTAFPGFAMGIRLAGQAPEGGRDCWRIAASAVYHRLAANGEAALWQGLAPSFRNQVRQAERNAVRVMSDRSPTAIERFYALHAALRNRKFQALPQPRRFFRLLHERFIAAGQGFVLEALHRDDVVAACIVLRHGAVLYYKFSASAPPANRLRANNLLLWELMRVAAAQGLALDLGRSGCGPGYAGLRHFKAALGAAAQPITSLDLPPRRPDGRAEEFTGLAQKLAHLLAAAGLDADGNDAAAELLYRYFA
jgi:Acetyltransferase (GNAT) domain